MNRKSWVEVDELETTRVEVDVAQVVMVAVESKTAAESKATHMYRRAVAKLINLRGLWWIRKLMCERWCIGAASQRDSEVCRHRAS